MSSRAPLLTEKRQDVRPVRLEDPRLAVTGRVEHEVIETGVEVGSKLSDVLVRVVGYEPPPVRDIFHRARQALHLARIIDAGLLFCGEGERRPNLGVFQSPRAIRVV